MFVCGDEYVRPAEKTQLAPFDQASVKETFAAGSDRGSPEQFLEWARGRPHPAEEGLPDLEADLEAAVCYVWSMGVHVEAHRQARMRTIEALAAMLEPLTRVLCGMMCANADRIAKAMYLNVMRRSEPGATLEDVGDRRYAPHYGLWCAILDSIRWPHVKMVRYMIRGFSSVGDIPDSGVWRRVERAATSSFHDFVQSNATWVRQCRAKVRSRATQEPEMAAACWERTIQERDAGLILGPYSISRVEKGTSFPTVGFGNYRPLPRFAVWQSGDPGKWRCIDDGAASDTNSGGTTTHETIVCDRPDSPLRIGIRFHELGPPPGQPTVTVQMGGGTDDAFAAYRRVTTADGEYTMVMVHCPADALHPGSGADVKLFYVPGHNFGLVSAGLNFNCLPEPFVHFSRRALGVPVTRFYDDEQVSEPSYTRGSGQAAHFQLHEIIRLHFDVGKHVGWARQIVYCGVETDWGGDEGLRGFATIGVTDKRKARLAQLIREAIDSGVLTPTDASKMRGKARWTVSPVFGRVGAAVVNLLRARQVCKTGTHEIDDELEQALELLEIAVRMLPKFVVHVQRSGPMPQVVILTDASFEENHKWLGFLVCCPIHGAMWAGRDTPQWLLEVLAKHKQRDTEIGQLEAIIVASPYFCPQTVTAVRNRNVRHYIDNQGACYSFIKGGSKDHDMNRAVFVSQMRMVLLSCNVWYDYVPSASNIADLPTRLDEDALRRLNKIGERVPLQLPPEWCLACGHRKLEELFTEDVWE